MLLKCGRVQILVTTGTNKNCVQEEIKSGVKFRDCLLPFGQNILSLLRSKDIMIGIYKSAQLCCLGL
jgi:hypothetical protein